MHKPTRFAAIPGSRLNACINFAEDKFHIYATGYRANAHLAYRYVVDANQSHDTLVYPIFFCWRQYLELTLKGLTRMAHKAQGQPPTFSKGHRLAALLHQLVPMLERLTCIGPTELGDITTAIGEFEALDPSSQAFRYPVGTDGAPSLPTDLYAVSLRKLDEVMEEVALILDSVYDCLAYHIEMEQEVLP